jgi:hypothetical protein
LTLAGAPDSSPKKTKKIFHAPTAYTPKKYLPEYPPGELLKILLIPYHAKDLKYISFERL